MTPAFTFRVQQQGSRAVLVLEGELDLDGADVLSGTASDLIEQGCRDLVLEMARVSFCDSMGLNALLHILRRATSAGGSLLLLSPTDPVKRLLSMCGVDRIVSMSDGSYRPTDDGGPCPETH
ncbi:STAS domain-containing protein [Streptacidiphilus sp. P02-A3a]|uniref:STAS domain-containing protein n=1 Tax=Streptacidiphilus sp. P02-A3a TaxID=2704468 RepID=UPI0015FC81FA|nr:STAS domain-containing protein [Streptacidiphilus sp. P02-A3a]QMU69636.1 STAS domain-containing protein [Streptacidiphilus sp. P02-A3a]